MPVVPLVKQLNGATLMVGETKWVKFENYPIPSSFRVRFQFGNGTHRWVADFSIEVSKHGTPTLAQVTVFGTPQDDFPIVRITSGHIPESHGVERWQLKIIEQHRFELLEMAIALAISMQGPNSKEGEQQWTSMEGSLTAIELKEVTRQIHRRIRQRITPEFLQSVANTYTRAALKNKNPIEAIAERFQCAHRTAQEYATKARQLDLLPPTSSGKVTVKKGVWLMPEFAPPAFTPGKIKVKRSPIKRPPKRKER